MLSKKFICLNTYAGKEESFKIKELSFHFKKLEKESKLTKSVQDVHAKNYQTVLWKIKKDLNKWRGIPQAWYY